MLNKTILMGRLTADPEFKQTPNGISVATFSLAVQRNYGKDLTDFINIVAWRQTADFVSKYFTKGQLVAVDGTIQTRNYTDKNGNKRTSVEVVADHAYFAESKPANKQIRPDVYEQPEQQAITGIGFSVGDMVDYEEIDTDDGDLPF